MLLPGISVQWQLPECFAASDSLVFHQAPTSAIHTQNLMLFSHSATSLKLFLLLTEITFSVSRVFRTPFQNTPDLLRKTWTVEQSCTKLPNTTGIFRIFYLNIPKCSFSATSFTEKARKRQMLCFSMIWFRALKPPKLDFKVNCWRWILSSSKWLNSSFPFLAKFFFLGSKDNTKSSSLTIVNPNTSNQRGWK